MNSVFNRQGVFSCAVDSFLKIWLRVINSVRAVAEGFNCYFVSLLKAVEQNFESTISSNNSFALQRLCEVSLPFFYKDEL